jgi:hypothetical protein
MAACALVVLLAGCPAGVAQQAAAKPVAVAAVSPQTAAVYTGAKRMAEEEETAKPSKPGSEGIKVHGHWVIDVRNADGTLVRHKDFENSLVTQGIGTASGDQLMAGLLSGNVTAGDPAIAFVSTLGPAATANDPTTYCGPYAATGGYCSVLTTPQSLLPSILNFIHLQTGMNAVVNFSPAVNWVLSGNWTVPSGINSVLYVQTLVPTCLTQNVENSSTTSAGALMGSLSGRSNDLSSKACAPTLPAADGPLFFTFTSTLVPNEPPAGMPVTPGQIITVTVTISFS